MEKAVNRKKTEIFDLIIEYNELVNLHKDKVSAHLKNEYFFKDMEENSNDVDDFEELKRFYFDLGVEFRQFVIKYNINHDLIKEKTVNIFLKQKPFTYLLKEKPDEKPIQGFQSILKNSGRKPNKIWVDHGSEFSNNKLEGFFKKMTLKCILHIMKENQLLLKDLSRI